MTSINNALPMASNTVDASSSALTTKTESAQKQQEILDAAIQFEALLISSMLKSMRATIGEDSLTGSEHQSLYMEMMDVEIAQKIASGGGLGLQEMITQQMGSTSAIKSIPTTDRSLDLIMQSRALLNSVD